MLGSESMVVAMFIRAGLLRKAPRSIPYKGIGQENCNIYCHCLTSGTSHSRHPREHTGQPRTSGRHSGADFVLGDLKVGLVALIVGFELQCLLEVINGFLVLIEATVGQPHAPVGLAVARVHVNGSLAILDCEVVIVHLAVGRGAVAVENWVGPVKLNGLGVHFQGLLELFCPHQVISLSFHPLGFLLVSC